MDKMGLLEREASGRLALGGYLVMLGEKDGKEVYTVEYDEEMTVGLPEVYLWDGEGVETMMGDQAGLIIASLSTSY